MNKPPISVKRCLQEIWSLSSHVFMYRTQIQVVIVQNGDVPVPWKTFCGKKISHPRGAILFLALISYLLRKSCSQVILYKVEKNV